MKRFLPRLFIYIAAFVFGGAYAFQTIPAAAAQAAHVVISEIQISGVTPTDEFIELYNPTLSDVNLTNWKLTKKTSGGGESDLVSSLSGTIKSHGFFLIAPTPDYTGVTVPDITYATSSASIAANNTVILYGGDGVTVVDMVGLGSATASETATTTNPADGKSRERKAVSASTTATMLAEDAMLGNGEDTDNNSLDFVLRNSPQPQNSNSAIEPEETATPTATLTPTMTEAPTSTPTPTEAMTPTPTLEITPTATVTPTMTSSPTPTATATPTMTPTPTPFKFPRFELVCTKQVLSFHIMSFTINTPFPVCVLVKK